METSFPVTFEHIVRGEWHFGGFKEQKRSRQSSHFNVTVTYVYVTEAFVVFARKEFIYLSFCDEF